jgi:hypothetical protein
MKKAIIQLWEISNGEENILSDGCSIHIDEFNRKEFIKEKNIIERVVGIPSEIFISTNIYEILLKEKNIRLSEIETNNLIGLKEIKPC